jgi:hypothetical protein
MFSECGGQMLNIDIMHDAEALVNSHGTRALEEAGKRARLFEDRGQKAQAERWRRIESALRDMGYSR